MSAKLLVIFFVPLIPLKGVCDSGQNISQTEMDYSWDYYESGYYTNSYRTAVEILFVYVIPTVAGLGVFGNVVVLVVWSTETAFNPTIFLMKCLAVTDTLSLLSVFSYIVFARWLTIFDVAVVALLFYCRMVTAHTSLGVVLTRWVAVHKPLTVHLLLTRRRVVLGYVLMLLWCLTPAIPTAFLLSGHLDDDYIGVVFSVCEAMYLALPILLLVVLNVSLVCRVCSHNRTSSVGQQHAARAANLLGAVVCLSVTTVLAFPVGVVVRILQISLDIEVCKDMCSEMVLAITILPEAFNSSINVVYYLLFASRFRQLCRLRCCCRRY